MNGLISIIMPTHNRAGLLPRAINSVMAQTFTNWELIVVADNCTDNTGEVFAKFLSDGRVSYLKVHENVGGAEARNIGLRVAKGEFIAFLDDDDEWLPQKLERQVQLFKIRDDVAIVSCNYFAITGTRSSVKKLPEIVGLDELLYHNECGSFSFCMTKREFLQSLELDKSLKACQDWDLWVRVVVARGLKCHVIQECLVRYYEHDFGRLTTNANNRYLSYLCFLRKHINLMNISQKNYNLAYLTYYKNCLENDGLVSKIKRTVKTAMFYLKSNKFRIKGFVTLMTFPFFKRT